MIITLVGMDMKYHIPSGKLTVRYWKITIFNREINYKWSFSIAMLFYQRVYLEICDIFLTASGEETEFSPGANRWESGREHESQTRHLKLGDGVAIPPIQDDPTVTG